MSMKLRTGIAGITLVVIVGLIEISSPSIAQATWLRGGGLFFFRNRCQPAPICVPEEPKKEVAKELPLPAVAKELQVNVHNIANLLKAGRPADARKLASMAAPKIEEVADLMHMHRARNKGGMGWGQVPGKNPAVDSIEKGLMIFAKAALAKDMTTANNNETAAYWIAAMAELTLAKAPKKDFGARKPRQAWIVDAEDLRSASLDLAKAAAQNDANAIRKSASKINSACINCHSKFKE